MLAQTLVQTSWVSKTGRLLHCQLHSRKGPNASAVLAVYEINRSCTQGVALDHNSGVG